ncbi:MAG: pitrilysin family protein, partial [Pyrinomonadaceae bacterium]
MIEDSPEEYLGEIFSEAFFGDTHPLGISIAGTPETVRSFNHEITRNYHERAFNAANLVITAAGNVVHDEVVELATAAFTTPKEPAFPDEGVRAPSMAAPIVIKQRADLEQAHLVIATPFISATDDRRYAADLLANIIGGGTSSRLWQKVREERGLAYNVGASASMYQDCGVFSIFAGSSPEQTREIVELSIAEMRAVVANGVTEDELDLAKQQSRASILLSLEDSASRAAALAQSEMVYGRQIAVEETLAKIDAVATRDIAAIAREFFTTENVAFAAIGDLDGDAITRDDLRL